MYESKCNGEEHQKSPECLMPSRDPYSSDGDDKKGSIDQRQSASRPLKRKNTLSRYNKRSHTSNHVEEHLSDIILPNPCCSSKLTAEEVLFFFDIDYIPQEEEIDFSSLPVEDILNHLFEFAFGDRGNSFLCNKTMADIYKEILDKKHCLAWMKKHDALNLYNVLKKDKLNHIKILQEAAKASKDDVKLMKNFLVNLYRNDFYTKDTACWKSDMYRLANALGIDLRYSGEIKHRFDYDIPYDVASNNSGIFETRYLSIIVQPSMVFMEEQSNLQKIVIEIFSQDKTSAISSHQDLQTHQPHNSSNSLSKHKPKRKLNDILDDDYRTQARRYVRKSLPSSCHDLECMNNIAGHHVLQLLSLADKQSRELHFNSYHVLGLFMLQNYIYFSQLEIYADRLKVIKRSDESYYENADIPPKVSFSNWCLDLLKSDHRIALSVFLSMYLKG